MDLLRDIRLTGRHLIKQAGYSSAAVVVLALGIGATSGIFSAVRIALGALRRDIVRLAMATAAPQAALGLVGGLAAALIGTRTLQNVLFGVTLVDGTTYAAVVALVLATVAVAAYLPARRAAALDPSMLLRRDD